MGPCITILFVLFSMGSYVRMSKGTGSTEILCAGKKRVQSMYVFSLGEGGFFFRRLHALRGTFIYGVSRWMDGWMYRIRGRNCHVHAH